MYFLEPRCLIDKIKTGSKQYAAGEKGIICSGLHSRDMIEIHLHIARVESGTCNECALKWDIAGLLTRCELIV